jgi:hypothetical protein
MFYFLHFVCLTKFDSFHSVCVGDSPRGPLKQWGKTSLKSRYRNTLSLTMQVTNHAGHGPRRGTPTAHQDGPLRSPLEQAPPRSTARAPSGGLRPVRGATLPSSGPAPLEGSLPLERVSSRSRVRPALGWGPPRSRAPRTRAPAPVHGHLTP